MGMIMRTTLSLALIFGIFALPHVAYAQTEWDGSPVSTTVYVNFASASARFQPSETAAAALVGAADAALVTIRGRTSTGNPTSRDEALALARAVASRSYLVAHGVSPLKITINYVSAADFIADNATEAGRLLNQRVEIDVVHVSPELTMQQKYQAALARREEQFRNALLHMPSRTASLN
jgi:hypothetical protein